MRKSEIIIGGGVLSFGVLLFIGAIFDINVWGLLCPTCLIALGVWLIYRTRQDPASGDVTTEFSLVFS